MSDDIKLYFIFSYNKQISDKPSKIVALKGGSSFQCETEKNIGNLKFPQDQMLMNYSITLYSWKLQAKTIQLCLQTERGAAFRTNPIYISPNRINFYYESTFVNPNHKPYDKMEIELYNHFSHFYK